MKSIVSFRTGFWLIISLNILMAFGSIWVFVRMSPAIEQIIDRNERTLLACEDMLTAVSSRQLTEDNRRLVEQFTDAIIRAENNITEVGEKESVSDIISTYRQAFAGDMAALKKTVEGINALSSINRQAMIDADRKAKQIGSAGAWGIVFMGTIVFLVSMINLRHFNRNISDTFDEIMAVLKDCNNGNKFRRCTGEVSRDSRVLFSELNKVLDSANDINNGMR